MRVRRAIVFLGLIFVAVYVCEAGKINKIQRLIDKNKLEKAEEVILKLLDKNEVSPGGRYFYSVLFSDTSFYKYNIDSAYYFIKGAFEDYDATLVDDLKELRKAGITILDFERQESFVTKLAYQRAKEEMTLTSVEKFLDEYSQAPQTNEVITYRDSLAFEIVLTENTWQAYKTYFETYPNSKYVERATDRYHVLIFEDYTKGDRLESYIKFLEEHPKTPFRKEAEEIIFVRSTKDNQWETYQKFLGKYPNTHLRKRIADISYYNALTDEAHGWQDVQSFHPAADSLVQAHELNSKILFPVYEAGSFGFMSLDGEEIVPLKYQSISDDYLCGNIQNHVLKVTLNGTSIAVFRSGETFIDDVDQIIDSERTLLVTGAYAGLYHKSGFKISNRRIDEVKELANGWITFSEDDKWGIITPAGYELIAPEYESILDEGSFILLEMDGYFAVSNINQMLEEDFKPEFQFDDYELISDTLIQAFRGDLECLINESLEFVRPLQSETIYVSNAFWYQKGDEGYEIFDIDDQEVIGESFDYLEVNEGWLTLEKGGKWLIISRVLGGAQPIRDLDSVKLINDKAVFIKKGDTTQVLFIDGKREWIDSDVSIRLLKATNSEYIMFASNDYQEVFNESGTSLFNSRFEQLSILSDSLFKFRSKGKYGILDQTGKTVLKAEYDLIDQQDDMIFLLKGDKIGSFDPIENVLISPEYESRIEKVGSFYKVQIDGLVGLLNKDDDEQLPIQFEDLRSWNDTALWAKEDNVWSLISYGGSILMEGILDYHTWMEGDDEIYAMFLGEEGYGLLSTKRGEMLAPEYNVIQNLGTSEQPVLFAEQHLRAAAFYVVTYFDLNANVMRSQAFRPEEYNRIYCDQ